MEENRQEREGKSFILSSTHPSTNIENYCLYSLFSLFPTFPKETSAI
jgi:hypothetical protein